MARDWINKIDDLANANMMIAGTTRGPGGSPGQRWDGLDRNPKPGDVLFGVEKGGQTFFKFLKALGLDKNDKIAGGPDYIGDKLRYGQLDRILNPFNDFRKPTLDQLRIHSKAYPK